MTIKHLVVVMMVAGAVTGCDNSAKTFGKSYDECILKNAREGGDDASRRVATDVCVRRFQQAVPIGDQDDTIAVERLSFYDVPDGIGAKSDAVQVRVHNSFADKLITEIEVVADFSDKPSGDNGKFPADAKIVTETWTFNANVLPNNEASFRGTFQTTKAPSRNIQIDAFPKKWVQLGSD